MSVVATAEERTVASRVARRTTPAAALASLGIVYGDLGTSPLYTLQRSSRPSVDNLPDLPSTLRAAKDLGCPVDLDTAVYFGAHDEVVPGKAGRPLSRWRLPLFAFLFRNSVRADDLFNLPPPNFVEIGRQIEI
jgi:K+ transporter